jgi:predicted lipid-binding transport protein (Tim44 family)
MVARTSVKASSTSSKSPAKKTATPRASAQKRRPALKRPTREATTRHADGGALSGLVLAMLLGALGFVASIFWIASMLVMALLLGLMLANRRTSSTHQGVVSELVAAVVDEVQDITESTSRASSGDTA